MLVSQQNVTAGDYIFLQQMLFHAIKAVFDDPIKSRFCEQCQIIIETMDALPTAPCHVHSVNNAVTTGQYIQTIQTNQNSFQPCVMKETEFYTSYTARLE